MAYNYNSANNSSSSDEAPAWDLRVKYTEILGAILEEIAIARRDNNFSDWFNLLDDNLYVELSKKLDEDEIKEYYNIRNKTVEIINANSSVLSKTDKDAHRTNLVKQSLKELDTWLGQRMEKHNLFGMGKSEDDDGL
jgi:hypothetical protein